ncbi:MAG: pantoate--beta-alanine ligase, partial [Planctomycetaceae bacterium]
MKTSISINETRTFSRSARAEGKTVGLVPTMGALHAGHISLMEIASDQCDIVMATIFVNPTQFGPNEDLDKYPRTLDDDLQKCEAAGVDFVFHPNVGDMYPSGADTFVEVDQLSRLHEGEHRSGHFRGVTTIVLKLFNIAEPTIAFFGQKDFQQQLLIKQMCRDLDVPIHIHTCPIVREPDGLALSSRNRYLSEGERKTALRLSASLQLGHKLINDGETEIAKVVTQMTDLIGGDDLS